MSGCPSCDGRPEGCMDCIDESALDLRPALVQVRQPTLNPDAHILVLKLEDAFKYLRDEEAAHAATKARVAKLEQFVQDLLLMTEKAPVALTEWEDLRADESDRKTRFERYSK